MVSNIDLSIDLFVGLGNGDTGEWKWLFKYQ